MKLFRVETAHEDIYNEVVSLLRNGGVIGFPTDTAYGLGADPFNKAAVDRIFQIKGRAETKPILLLVDSLEMADAAIQPSDLFHRVAERFWPGPLTMISCAADSLPENVTAGTKTIGLRWPLTSFATRLVGRFGAPITATSANRSGLPSATTADDVRRQLGDTLDALIEGGSLPYAVGSTLLDLTVDPPLIVREGPVSYETLAEFFKGRIRRRVA